MAKMIIEFDDAANSANVQAEDFNVGDLGVMVLMAADYIGSLTGLSTMDVFRLLESRVDLFCGAINKRQTVDVGLIETAMESLREQDQMEGGQ